MRHLLVRETLAVSQVSAEFRDRGGVGQARPGSTALVQLSSDPASAVIRCVVSVRYLTTVSFLLSVKWKYH